MGNEGKRFKVWHKVAHGEKKRYLQPEERCLHSLGVQSHDHRGNKSGKVDMLCVGPCLDASAKMSFECFKKKATGRSIIANKLKTAEGGAEGGFYEPWLDS